MQHELTAQLSRDAGTQPERTGWQCVRSILAAAVQLDRDQLLSRLADEDRELARALASDSSPDTTATGRRSMAPPTRTTSPWHSIDLWTWIAPP